MLFRKKQSKDAQRARNAVINRGSAGSNAQPVFSYHARTARTEAGGSRRASVLPWANPKPSAPRPAPHGWHKRVILVAALVLVALLVVSNLMLGRSPGVVLVGADTASHRLFLHSIDVYSQAAAEVLGSSWTNTTKLTIHTAHVAEVIQKQFPELEHVTVTLPIVGRQPVIYLQAAKPALLLKTTDGGLLIVDTRGRALANASMVKGVERLGLTVVEDQSGLPVTPGNTALPSDNILFITEVLGQLKAKSLQVTGMVLPKGTSEVDVHLNGVPYFVKYNLRGDARAEVGAFLAVKQYVDQAHKTPSTYIDVRVDNKAYYR